MPRTFSIDFSSVKEHVPVGARLTPGFPCCDFSNPRYEPAADLPDNIVLDSVIRNGKHSDVYHAHGIPPGETKSVELVVKFAPLSALATEAGAYDSLQEESLTGTVTPLFYGMLLAKVPNRGELGCIITERWGTSLTRDFCDLPKEDKINILKKLLDIHEVGILHCDFEPRNVLQKDGDFRIIDFGDIEDHVCSPGTRYLFDTVGEFPSQSSGKICAHIWSLALMEMNLWEQGFNFIQGAPYKKSEHKLPLQHQIFEFPLPYKRYGDLDGKDWDLQFYIALRDKLDSGMTLEELKSEENIKMLMDVADAKAAKCKNMRRS
ncbi:hypothetical protein C8J56DRAFT_1045264 [Mycena floridula]|nr:hypothetical protein C8J56DRAFT_1045264 [Mycena floridula]